MSQLIDPKDGYIDASSWLLDNTQGFLPTPILITEPAIGYGGGIAIAFFHETKEQKSARLQRKQGELTPASGIPRRISFGMAMGTDNGTKAYAVGHYGGYFDDQFRYTAFAADLDINIDFYTPESKLPPISEKPIAFNVSNQLLFQDFKFSLNHSDFYIGIRLTGLNTRLQLKKIGDLNLASSRWDIEEYLSNNIASLGYGMTFSYDSRDAISGAVEGINTELESMAWREEGDSNKEFFKNKFFTHYYFIAAKDLYAGLRFDYRNSNGDTPFYQLPFISLMGIPIMRYQGQHVLVGEANLRWQFHPRWSVLTFAGTGVASESFNSLNNAHSRSSKGIGFRYLAAKQLRLHTGIDIAWGPEDTAFYIQTGIGF